MTRHPDAISTKLFAISERMKEHGFAHIDANLVYWAANLYLATEQADVQKPERAACALADLHSSMSWALPQYKCGNMSEQAVFDYMFFCISRVSPDVTMRALVERLRLAESERDHLKYFARSGLSQPSEALPKQAAP